MSGYTHCFLLIAFCLLTCTADHGARAQSEEPSVPTSSNDTTDANPAANDTTLTSDREAPETTTFQESLDSAQGINPPEVSANDTSAQKTGTDLPPSSPSGTSSPSDTATSSADPDLPSASATETSSPTNITTASVDSDLPSPNATETSSPTNSSAPVDTPADIEGNATSPTAPTTIGTTTEVATTTEIVTSPPDENVTAGETTEVTSTGDQTTGTMFVSTTATASSWEEEQTAEADFIIRDDNNNSCLLANLDVTILIFYNTRTEENQTYENTMPGPGDVIVTGSCGINASTLQLTWSNRTFALRLAFVLQDAGDSSSEGDTTPGISENPNSTWSLRQISLTYNMSDQTIFPAAADPTLQTTGTGDLNLFSTPLGQSYLCHQPQLLDVEFPGARLVFNHVHLMAFGVNGTRFSADTEDCLAGGASQPAPVQEAYTVPLIVAGCLAAVVIVIVLGYAISRCVTRHKRQMEYKQMP